MCESSRSSTKQTNNELETENAKLRKGYEERKTSNVEKGIEYLERGTENFSEDFNIQPFIWNSSNRSRGEIACYIPTNVDLLIQFCRMFLTSKTT